MDEAALLESALHGPTAEARISEARQFLARFPENPKRRDVARKLYADGLETKDAAAALEGAEIYVASTPADRQDRLKNQLAWRMAENGINLDWAERMAREVVAAGRETQAPALASYLDTLAFVLSAAGKPTEALDLQAEAVGLQEGDPAMTARLALYQEAAGRRFEAISTAADAILLGAEGEVQAAYRKWMGGAADSAAPDVVLRDLVLAKAEAFLQEGATPLRQGRAAHLYALSGVELAQATQWAASALDDALSSVGRGREVQARIVVAAVKSAAGDYAGAVQVLQEGADQATPFDSAFWLALGHNYRLDNRRTEAEAALLTPLILREDRQARSELNGLGLSDDAIDERLEQRKLEMLRFDPGHYPGQPTGRVVLAELFTGAECNPCQAADHAFDLLSEYYPREILVILEHHVHIPGADPLTNQDTEARYQFYGGNLGTPTVFFNGVERVSGGGPELLKRRAFEDYDRVIQRLLTEEPAAEISGEATLKDDAVEVRTRARTLREGPAAAVRIALVERSVEYLGGNGINPHAWVVRRVFGTDTSPFLLEAGTTEAGVRFKLPELERKLEEYLAAFEQNPPERYQGFGGFTARPTRIDRSRLGVAVWVQELESRQVLQSAFVPIQ